MGFFLVFFKRVHSASFPGSPVRSPAPKGGRTSLAGTESAKSAGANDFSI